ncbi:hypothetical protein B0H19DRAFT_1196080 [Mycena capillaripes]|nr:hypothetical protein B0H19DRAFT_1196080 [Mycena capillaripes]
MVGAYPPDSARAPYAQPFPHPRHPIPGGKKVGQSPAMRPGRRLSAEWRSRPPSACAPAPGTRALHAPRSTLYAPRSTHQCLDALRQ